MTYTAPARARSLAVRRAKAPLTHCPQEHPMTQDNTYVAPRSGARSCRICRRAAKQKFDAAHKKGT